VNPKEVDLLDIEQVTKMLHIYIYIYIYMYNSSWYSTAD